METFKNESSHAYFSQSYEKASEVPMLVMDAADDLSLLQTLLEQQNHSDLTLEVEDIITDLRNGGYLLLIKATGKIDTEVIGLDDDGLPEYHQEKIEEVQTFFQKGYFSLRQVAEEIICWAHALKVGCVEDYFDHVQKRETDEYLTYLSLKNR